MTILFKKIVFIETKNHPLRKSTVRGGSKDKSIDSNRSPNGIGTQTVVLTSRRYASASHIFEYAYGQAKYYECTVSVKKIITLRQDIQIYNNTQSKSQ